MVTGKFILVLMMCVRTGSDGSELKCVDMQISPPVSEASCKDLKAIAVDDPDYDVWPNDIGCIPARLIISK